jgi:hypothetical protein
MTRAVLRAARDAGLRIAALQASDAGRRIYERIGFREVCRFRLHEWTPRRVERDGETLSDLAAEGVS